MALEKFIPTWPYPRKIIQKPLGSMSDETNNRHTTVLPKKKRYMTLAVQVLRLPSKCRAKDILSTCQILPDYRAGFKVSI
jgi:hypothetical protein